MKYDLTKPADRMLFSLKAAQGTLDSEPPPPVHPEFGSVRQEGLETSKPNRAGFRRVGYCWPGSDGTPQSSESQGSVSYTHLTLPTIYSV